MQTVIYIPAASRDSKGMRFTLFFMLAFLPSLCGFAHTALAASAFSNVGSARINEGELTLEQRFGYVLTASSPHRNHRRFRSRQHIDYGFTDYHAARLTLAQDNRPGDTMEHDGITVENRFQLVERKDYGWDGGVRLIYTHRDGDKTPHEIDFRLLAQVPLGEGWEFRHNSIFEHDIGENSRGGLMLEISHQIAKTIALEHPYARSLRLGLQLFNDFGRLNETGSQSRQEHHFGPVAKVSFNQGYFLQTGIRYVEAEDSRYSTVKLFLGRKF